jgi:hypothetical protein
VVVVVVVVGRSGELVNQTCKLDVLGSEPNRTLELETGNLMF